MAPFNLNLSYLIFGLNLLLLVESVCPYTSMSIMALILHEI